VKPEVVQTIVRLKKEVSAALKREAERQDMSKHRLIKEILNQEASRIIKKEGEIGNET